MLARAVSTTGSVSAEATVAGGASFQHQGDVGGESTLIDDTALCVWKSDGDQQIQAREVGISANLLTGRLTVRTTAPVFMVAGSSHDGPRISRSGGAAQRYAVVTTFRFGFPDADPVVTIVDSRGQPRGGDFLSNTRAEEYAPDVDGDGTNWVAAWNRLSGPNDNDVYATAFSWDPLAFTGLVFNSGAVPIEADPNQDEVSPSVCWTGGSCLIGYTQQVVPGLALWDSLVRSVDLFHCTECEGIFGCAAATGPIGPPQAACKLSGGSASEAAVLVWELWSATFKGDIFGQGWSTVDGNVTQAAGSCGQGGTCHTTCARLKNSAFTFELRDSRPSQPTVFLLSGTRLDFPCGPCTIVPNPATGVVVGMSTNASGDVSLGSPIPNNVSWLNVPLFVQWATVNLATPPCAPFKLELSNALQMMIEK